MFFPTSPLARVVVGLLIHLAVPATGLAIYLYLCGRMRFKEIKNPPYAPLFILFFSFGGWLMVLLTILFWLPSGAMYLGGGYLLLLAPVLMLVLIVSLYEGRTLSKYHLYSYRASIAYEVMLGILILLWICLIIRFNTPMR